MRVAGILPAIRERDAGHERSKELIAASGRNKNLFSRQAAKPAKKTQTRRFSNLGDLGVFARSPPSPVPPFLSSSLRVPASPREIHPFHDIENPTFSSSHAPPLPMARYRTEVAAVYQAWHYRSPIWGAVVGQLSLQ